MVDPGTISPARKEDFDQYVKKYETSRRASTGNVAKTESRRSLQLKGLKANYSDSRELHRASSSRRKLAEVISFRTLAGSKKTLELFYRFMQIKEAASLLEFWFEAENFRHRNWKVLQILGIVSTPNPSEDEDAITDEEVQAESVYVAFKQVTKAEFTPQMITSLDTKIKEGQIEQKMFNVVQEVVYDTIETYVTEFLSMLNNKGLDLVQSNLAKICHADATIMAVAYAHRKRKQ